MYMYIYIYMGVEVARFCEQLRRGLRLQAEREGHEEAAAGEAEPPASGSNEEAVLGEEGEVEVDVPDAAAVPPGKAGSGSAGGQGLHAGSGSAGGQGLHAARLLAEQSVNATEEGAVGEEEGGEEEGGEEPVKYTALVTYFVGVHSNSHDVLVMLRCLCARVIAACGLPARAIPQHFNLLCAAFHRLLIEAGRQHRLLLLVDGTEMLYHSRMALPWHQHQLLNLQEGLLPNPNPNPKSTESDTHACTLTSHMYP